MMKKISACWINDSSEILISGISIKLPYFYLAREDRDCIDSQYVQLDSTAPVLFPLLPIQENPKYTKIFYSYTTMSPWQRLCYIKWLGGDRSILNICADVVLYYIYGLEYRAFIDDSTPKTDIENIYKFVVSFLEHFSAYSCRVKTNAVFKRLSNLKEYLEIFFYPNKVLLYNNKVVSHSPSLKKVLVDLIIRNEEVGVLNEFVAFKAMNAIFDFEEIYKENEKQSVYEYFLTLYNQESCNLSKTRSYLTYPFTNLTSSTLQIRTKELISSQIYEFKYQLNKVIPILDSLYLKMKKELCNIGEAQKIHEKVHSIYLVRNLHYTDTLVKEFINYEVINELLSKYVNSEFSRVKVKYLLPDKYYSDIEIKSEMSLLNRILKISGFGVVPSSQIYKVSLSYDDEVIIFKLDSGDVFEPTYNYRFNELLILSAWLISGCHLTDILVERLMLLIEKSERNRTNIQYHKAMLYWLTRNKISALNLNEIIHNELSYASRIEMKKTLVDLFIDNPLKIREISTLDLVKKK